MPERSSLVIWSGSSRTGCGDAFQRVQQKTCTFLPAGAGDHRCGSPGVLCGLFGVGALLAAYVNRVTDEDSSFKANISAVFIVDNTFRIILYSALGLLTFDTVLSVLKLIPFALLGLFLGIKCSNHMDGKNVKKITSVLLILSGISLILKNL